MNDPKPNEVEAAPSVEAAVAQTTLTEPSPTTTIPADRNFLMKRPGNVAVSVHNTQYPGCKMIRFKGQDGGEEEDTLAEDEMNAYFTKYGNMLLVDWRVCPDGSILAFITNTMDAEDLEEMNAYGGALQEFMREFKEEKQKRIEEQAKAVETEMERLNRLAAIGAQCEEHHKALLKDKRKEKKGKR